VIIPVSETEDEVLFPNPHACAVLKKVNHAALQHFDNIEGIKEDRKKIENALGLNKGGGFFGFCELIVDKFCSMFLQE
jgi:hypothetical protein